MELRELCLKIIKDSPFEAEVFAVSSKTFSVEVRGQKTESVNSGRSIGISLRLLNDKKTGFSYSNTFDTETLIKKAADNLLFSPQDSFFHFVPHAKAPTTPCSFDKAIGTAGIEEKTGLAMKTEAAAYAFDKRIVNTESASYSDEEYEVYLATSNGFSAGYSKTLCGCSMQAISQENGISEEGYFVKQYGRLDELLPEEIGRKAASNATELLGGRLIKSGIMPVILSPLVSAQFLAAAAPIFSAENIRKGKSLFAGKLGRQCGSEILNIAEDALLQNGLASRPFDDEGMPSKRIELIKNGKLKSFLHNLDSASRENTVSTSSACRNSFKAPPSIGTTNLYIEQGKAAPEALLLTMEKGLYITRVMALHCLNPISGDFSLGAAGIMVENGKKTFPVRGITIAGNLAELFLTVKDIGNDLEFFPETGHCGSPSLLIEKLAVSGE